MITNDAVIFGLLTLILMFVFRTSHSDHPFWKKFYRFIPSLLLCYFLPSLMTSTGLVSNEQSNLYFVASRYLLPASLVLLTISIDLNEIMKLGSKALIMFFTGTIGIVVGGPLAILIVSAVSPETVGGVGPEAVWRGLTTVAGSWIGGGANMAAMKEIFQVGDDLFSSMIAVDVLVASVWMAFVLYGVGISDRIDRFFNADATAIMHLKDKMAAYQAQMSRIPALADSVTVVGIGFGVTAFAHLAANGIAPWIRSAAPILARFSLTSEFFWIIVIATTVGVFLSFTPLRSLEGVGASRFGSLFLYILVATIGLDMNILAVLDNPGLFMVGAIWLAFHALLLIFVAKMIRAPFFFLAIGSEANVGGAASAPIIASAFHPSLAPVGVLLAVLGYAVGTYGAWLCGIIMQGVSP